MGDLIRFKPGDRVRVWASHLRGGVAEGVVEEMKPGGLHAVVVAKGSSLGVMVPVTQLEILKPTPQAE